MVLKMRGFSGKLVTIFIFLACYFQRGRILAIKSKALEVNIADYHVDVTIDPKYSALHEAMSQYFGIREGVSTFLEELSHPYKNWQFIVNEARNYSLDYFHLLKRHPQGVDAARCFVEIFSDAILADCAQSTKMDSVDNLMLFIQKIIRDSGDELDRFFTVICHTFQGIQQYPDDIFLLFVKSHYQIKQLGEIVLQSNQHADRDCSDLNRLIGRYFQATYDYWLSEKDPQLWFENETGESEPQRDWLEFFDDISHTSIRKWKQTLSRITAEENVSQKDQTALLIQLTGYNQIVEFYRKLPEKLQAAGATSNKGNRWKVIFLFLMMNVSGLSIIHEETLRDINRTLSWLIGKESNLYIWKLIEKTFSILHTQAQNFPATALSTVLNMGKGVYKTDDSDLVNHFIENVIDLGFQAPMVAGVGDDWQVKVNPSHILNIRTWLELIELNPKHSIRLISSLTVYLSLCGVFIKDTDLFPRDITRILNSEIEPVYNLIKQLARLFPVYFNDIGAEGKLRDISTRIDELCQRKDILVHFLRKQSHVESSNLIIHFIEATLKFWQTRDKERIKPFVPPIIYNQIRSEGPFIDGIHTLIDELARQDVRIPEDLLTIEDERLTGMLAETADAPESDRERVSLAVSFYRHLYQKYHLDFIAINNHVRKLKTEGFPGLDKLEAALAEPSLRKKIAMMLEYLEFLKYLILSDKPFEVREDIYKKRHFTVDIPSMYGSYHEMKFDALGLTYRLESLVNTLFEELVKSTDLSLITKATFYQIYDHLKLFDKALNVEGVHSVEIERQMEMLAHSLEVRGFTFTQYLDIFKGFARAVKNVINDHFGNIHGKNLVGILERLPSHQILKKYLPANGEPEKENIKHRISEIFFRDRIAMTTGIQQLDLFLGRILNTLFQQSNKLPKDQLQQLLLYDPKNAVAVIHHANPRISGIIHLGSKGLNMVKLNNYNLPVPPGFILTTEVFRCREIIESYQPAKENFKDQVLQHIAMIERVTGKLFGDSKNPLLFSVRSGSSISQPGMMDTFLNVGINEEITEGIAAVTDNSWFAWDSYRRFLQCFGMSYGLERDEFDSIIGELKRRAGAQFKRDLTGQQMRKVALTYKRFILDAGVDLMEDPLEQLYETIRNVLSSWDSARARTYRKIMGISNDWGTAVTIQTMVFGNMSEQSGAGVFFTHNPRWSGDSLRLWGDFTIGNQGEDVVSGLVNTLPISISQQDIELRETDITLETHFPRIYAAMKNWAIELIERRGWSPQEMEFTFEGPEKENLYLLQTRDMGIRERKKVMTFDLESVDEDRMLGHGIGVSGGAISGRIVFSLQEIDTWRSSEPETPLILVRSDTVPDDIKEIYASDGLLTSRGGVTSHAAVVTHRLGKTSVVGCNNMICDEKGKICIFGDVRLASGDRISIDGREGSVYSGTLPVNV
jgi:pyruvate, orthophosphate dikinase